MGIHKKLQVILDLHAQYPNKYRHNCPFCQRNNSLSIQIVDSVLKYKCFGATCKTSGIYKSDLSIQEINTRREVNPRNHVANLDTIWSIPAYFTSAIAKPECLAYLRKYNILEAYGKSRVKLRYDPKQNRLVFLIYNASEELVGATGRLLSFVPNTAKWYIYGNPGPFVCGTKDTGIIVEDCTSATRVSEYLTGIAILGTNFLESNLPILKRYKKIIIALDKDALKKSLEIEASIRFYADTSILLLNEDLKELDDMHLKELLGKYINPNSLRDLS